MLRRIAEDYERDAQREDVRAEHVGGGEKGCQNGGEVVPCQGSSSE
jgi:hypothetical protein